MLAQREVVVVERPREEDGLVTENLHTHTHPLLLLLRAGVCWQRDASSSRAEGGGFNRFLIALAAQDISVESLLDSYLWRVCGDDRSYRLHLPDRDLECPTIVISFNGRCFSIGTRCCVRVCTPL